MNDPAYCPLAIEQGLGPNSAFKAPFDGRMTWSVSGVAGVPAVTCSFCGSLHPDDLMPRLEAGEVELTPTDKAYKVYVSSERHGVQLAKFYFQHLSREQQVRFGELLVEGRLRLSSPGHFYVTPFFLPQPGATQS